MLRAPTGWMSTVFGAILDRRQETAHGGERLLSVTADHGVVPQETTGRRNVSSSDKSAYIRVCPGDIVYNTMRMWQGVSGCSSHYGIVSPAYTVCIPHAGVDGNFIAKLLRHAPFVAQFRRLSQGLTSDVWNLRYSMFSTIPLNLPSIDEQIRIAKVLDEVDGLSESSAEIIEKYQAIELAVLRDAVFLSCKHAAEEHRGRWCKVGEAGQVLLGRQRADRLDTTSGQTRYLRVANVFDGYIDYSDVSSMGFTRTEQAMYELKPGDILLNEGQSLDLVGRSAIYDGPANICFQNTLIRFRPNALVLPEYAHIIFRYWLHSGEFSRIAKRTTSIAHLGADRFSAMKFPLIDISQQQRLVERLKVIVDCMQRESATVTKLHLVKKGLMDDLLTGKVQVGDVDSR